ncbi:hypothetical protein J7443_07160 [Tropicibacter sp. R15_0]|uniref:hypothetical protein n=1 Tax=Tropicibacter sp. R15_0 TaxID=2821101 RepID=UPI001AD95DCE|nr:hypothetical protein [Tropicibacter sp. R15_0]MBO9465001.1 hypothetical protein [Tropicibacter sp. R15_0]
MSDYPPFQIRNWHRSIETQVPQKALRDLKNRLLFGPAAPKSDERIFIDPRRVTRVFQRRKGMKLLRRHTGLVRGGDWDLSTRPLQEMRKFRAVWEHFVENKSWEETGIIESMLQSVREKGIYDGCRNRDDILKRYRHIDALYDSIRRLGRVQSMAERPEFFRREYDGVFVHVDRHGEVMLAGNGNHRLAIAKVLGLKSMPAQLGVVHRDAVESGAFDKLRQVPASYAEASGWDAPQSA